MEMISRLSEENIEEYIELLPYEYLGIYEYAENTFMYGMSDEGIPCGIALLENENDDVIIHYLNTYGKNKHDMYSFVNFIAYELYQQGVERLIWKYLEDDDFDYKLMLANLGFVSTSDDIAVFEFSIKDLLSNDFLNTMSRDTVSLKDIGGFELKKFCAEITNEFKNIVEMPIKKELYVADCSAVYMEKNVPKGILLLQMEEDILHIPYIYSGSSNPKAIIEMMRFMFSQAKKKYSEYTICKIYVVDPLLVRIVEKVTGITGKYQQIAVRNLNLFSIFENNFVSGINDYETDSYSE